MSDVNAKSATQEKAGPLALAWDWVKALPLNFKNIAVNLVRPTKKLGQDDPRRVMHSLKVGLALTLLSLLYYWRPLYNGATLSKGLNRACATLSAGALGCGAHHLARLFGAKGHPIVLGLIVFLLRQREDSINWGIAKPVLTLIDQQSFELKS
nr:aluminum-activated malate transporter 8 [Quercus suber]